MRQKHILWIFALFCVGKLWAKNDTLLAHKDFVQGLNALKNNQITLAKQYLTHSLEKAIPTWKSKILASYYLGECYIKENNWDSAKVHLLPLQSALSQLPIEGYSYFSDIFLLQKQLPQSIEYAKQAWKISEEKLGKKDTSVAKKCLRIGFLYRNYNPDSTVFYYDKVLSYFPQYTQTKDGYTVLGATLVSYTGFYVEFGEYEKAVELGLDAIKLYDYHRCRVGEYAQILRFIGRAYSELGDLEKGVSYKKRALETALSIYPAYDYNLATYYNALGSDYRLLGEYEKSISFYQQANQITIKHKGEQYFEVAYNNINLGNVYGGIDEYQKAIEYYQKASVVLEQDVKRFAVVLAKLYSNIGQVKMRQDSSSSAVVYHLKSLQLLKEQLGEKHPTTLKQMGNIAEFYLLIGQLDKAKRYAQQAQVAMQGIFGNHHFEIANTYLTLCKTYIQAEQWDSAQIIIRKAKEANTDRGRSINQSTALVTLSLKGYIESCYARQNKTYLDTALQTYFSYHQLCQKIRNTLLSDQDKVLFMSDEGIKTTYDQAVEVCLTYQNYEKAFFFMEQSKSAVLYTSLADAHAKSVSGIPDTLLQKENSLKKKLTQLEKSLLEEQSLGKNQNVTLVNLYQAEYFETYQKWLQGLQYLEQNFPEYYALKYQLKDLSLAQIQQQLDKKTALIEYTKTDKNLFILTITQQKVWSEIHPLPEDFDGRIVALRRALRHKLSAEYWIEDAKILQQILLPKQINNYSNLVVISEGNISRIPLEVLVSAQSTPEQMDYNVYHYNISYMYSARLWYDTQQKMIQPTQDFIAFAPIFDVEKPTLLANGLTVSGLPGTLTEVKSITENFLQQGRSAVAYLYHDAKEYYLKQTNLSHYRYLHFATHGYLNPLHTNLSCIMLNPEVTGNEDGILYVGEMYALKLQAELVCLSACETGLGKIALGEGTLGITRALLYAGAKNITVSLWEVNDKATTQLMTNFYEQILTRKTPLAQALSKAKQSLLTQKQTQHPYYWAAFVLIGAG